MVAVFILIAGIVGYTMLHHVLNFSLQNLPDTSSLIESACYSMNQMVPPSIGRFTSRGAVPSRCAQVGRALRLFRAHPLRGSHELSSGSRLDAGPTLGGLEIQPI